MNKKLSAIKQVKTSFLKVNASNKQFFNEPNPHELKNLTADISKRGILVPLIAKSDGILLAGHSRLLAARKLKLKTVPARIMQINSSEEELEFLLKDNILRRHLGREERKIIYRTIYPDFDTLILQLRSMSIEKISEISGINYHTINLDFHEIRKWGMDKRNPGRANKPDLILHEYKKCVSKILNLISNKEKINIDEIIETTKTVLKRFQDIKDFNNAKEIKCPKVRTLISHSR